MDFVSDEDLAPLAKSHTVATLLPAANYFLGLPIVSARPQADRRRRRGGAGYRLQPRHRAHAVDAVRPVSGLHAHEDVSGRSDHRRDLQRRLRAAAATAKGSLEPGKDADIAIFDAQDYRELAYWFGVNRCWKTWGRRQQRQ